MILHVYLRVKHMFGLHLCVLFRVKQQFEVISRVPGVTPRGVLAGPPGNPGPDLPSKNVRFLYKKVPFVRFWTIWRPGTLFRPLEGVPGGLCFMLFLAVLCCFYMFYAICRCVCTCFMLLLAVLCCF